MQHTVHIRTNGNLSLYVAKFTNNEMSYFNIFSNNHVRTPIITKEHVSSQKIQWGWASAIWQLDSLFDTVHIVCGAGSIKRSGVRTSICPSVSLSHQSNAVAAGLLLSAVRAKDIDRQRRAPGSSSAAARVCSTALSSKCGQRHVDSRINEAEHRQFHYLQSRRSPFACTSGHATLSLRMRETVTG